MHTIDFAEPPPVGTELWRFSSRYVCVGVEPYTRRDGAVSALLVWAGHCADCGAPITCRTGLRSHGINRRCDAHKAPRRPACGEAAARANAMQATRGAARAKRREAKRLAGPLAKEGVAWPPSGPEASRLGVRAALRGLTPRQGLFVRGETSLWASRHIWAVRTQCPGRRYASRGFGGGVWIWRLDDEGYAALLKGA